MTVINSRVFHVLEKFPDRSGEIKRLFKESPSFQTICGDYRKCIEALHHWNQSHAKEAPARREEYATLLHDLEVEILQSLDIAIHRLNKTIHSVKKKE